MVALGRPLSDCPQARRGNHEPKMHKILIAVLMSAWTVDQSVAQDRRYNQPRWFDDRLDWCLNWATSCVFKCWGGCRKWADLYIMMHIRGHRSDFDAWAYQGCPGWGYDDVLPYFQKLEDQEDDTSPVAGHDGPLRVLAARLHDPNPASQAFLDACQELGFPRTDDFNGPQMEGAGWHHLNIKNGLRHDMATPISIRLWKAGET
jgi:GMC oxidoreductase